MIKVYGRNNSEKNLSRINMDYLNINLIDKSFLPNNNVMLMYGIKLSADITYI